MVWCARPVEIEGDETMRSSLDFDGIQRRVDAMVMLGVPYGDAVNSAPAMAREQARTMAAGIEERLGLTRRMLPLQSTRAVTKADMRNNDALPRIDIRPDTFDIRIDGELVEPAPAARLPLAQLYQLF